MRPCGKRMEVSGYRATWSADIMSLHTSLQKRHKTSLCFLSKQSTLISKMLCIVVMNERVQNSGVGVFKQPLLTG